MIECTLGEVLEKRGKSLYWLAGEIRMHYPALWKIKANKTKSIKHVTLSKICAALECQPGDIFKYIPKKKK